MSVFFRLIALLIVLVVSTNRVCVPADRGQNSRFGPNCEDGNRDKTGTTTRPENNTGSQDAANQQLTSRVSFEAEGRGFEPPTAFAAPDFESGCWPIRLPSSSMHLIKYELS
jgi:hypothetical protein